MLRSYVLMLFVLSLHVLRLRVLKSHMLESRVLSLQVPRSRVLMSHMLRSCMLRLCMLGLHVLCSVICALMGRPCLGPMERPTMIDRQFALQKLSVFWYLLFGAVTAIVPGRFSTIE